MARTFRRAAAAALVLGGVSLSLTGCVGQFGRCQSMDSMVGRWTSVSEDGNDVARLEFTTTGEVPFGQFTYENVPYLDDSESSVGPDGAGQWSIDCGLPGVYLVIDGRYVNLFSYGRSFFGETVLSFSEDHEGGAQEFSEFEHD